MNHHVAFVQYFSKLKDPRQATKIEYPFFDVLFLTGCAVIGGAEGWEDIEMLGEAHLEWFQRNGLFTNGLPHCQDDLAHSARAVPECLLAMDAGHRRTDRGHTDCY